MLYHYLALRNRCEYALLTVFNIKMVFLLTTPAMPVSLNQYRGETGSFYNRSTSQITELTVSLFNILVNFTENVSVYDILIVLIVSTIFLTLLDQFSSCNFIYLWNFMTHFFYLRLLLISPFFLLYFRLIFSQTFWESLTCLCYMEILNRIQVQGLIRSKLLNLSLESQKNSGSYFFQNFSFKGAHCNTYL